MTLTTRGFAGLVLAAAAIVLGTALLSQYWGGLVPCEMCLWQRWPWMAAITIAMIVLLGIGRARLLEVALVLALVFVVGTGLAAWHVGVEQHWLAGPGACTARTTATTIEELRRQIENQQPVLCDQMRPWLLGVSLAGWNLLASLIMTAACLVVAARAPRRVPRLGLSVAP
jgi:disulfide bond formation protein DsbB